MKYQEINPLDRSEAEAIFRGSSLDDIRLTLVRVAYHDPDYLWAQENCLRFCNHPNKEVRAVAAICLGHIARIHGKLDVAKVKPILQGLLSDTSIAGQVEDAIDDVERFAEKIR